MFLMKKILAQFLMPLSLGLAISYLGLFLLLFSSRQRSGKFFASFGILAITLLSIEPLADQLLKPLEGMHPSYENSRAADISGLKYIVVLGGGHVSDKSLPATSRIATPALARLVEAIRIHRLHPESKLLLSGGRVFDPVPEADTLAEIALSIGVEGKDIITETESKDTEDEARIIKSMIGDDKFILVTSASHMPRSMALFNHLGMTPLPAPTQHLVREESILGPRYFFPNTDALIKSERVFYERLGLAWARLRNLI